MRGRTTYRYREQRELRRLLRVPDYRGERGNCRHVRQRECHEAKSQVSRRESGGFAAAVHGSGERCDDTQCTGYERASSRPESSAAAAQRGAMNQNHYSKND